MVHFTSDVKAKPEVIQPTNARIILSLFLYALNYKKAIYCYLGKSSKFCNCFFFFFSPPIYYLWCLFGIFQYCDTVVSKSKGELNFLMKVARYGFRNLLKINQSFHSSISYAVSY